MNSKKKVLCVFGTRPEVIKMAPVVHALKACKDIHTAVCTSSQHRDMQDHMMNLFELTSDYDLNVMIPGQDLFYLTTEIVSRLKNVLKQAQPDLVLVHGDTTTCFAAALAAFYYQVPIGHIEAGLRTYQLNAPFPEEANRQLVSRLATLHFAPTALAAQNLLAEGSSKNNIFITGNTVIDALFWIKKNKHFDQLHTQLPQDLVQLIRTQAPYILITGHRRENFGEGFKAICEALLALAIQYPHWHFVYPVHLNPQVQGPVFETLSGHSNIHLCEPVGYEAFVYFMEHCRIVLTDSGGVQEEAPSLGKPVLVMRNTTERPEGIEAGTARLVGTSKKEIMQGVTQLIEDPAIYKKMSQATNPYGDGKAAEKIAQIIANQFFGSAAC